MLTLQSPSKTSIRRVDRIVAKNCVALRNVTISKKEASDMSVSIFAEAKKQVAVLNGRRSVLLRNALYSQVTI